MRTPALPAGAAQGRAAWLKGDDMLEHDLALGVVAPPGGSGVVQEAYTDEGTTKSGLAGNVRLTIVVSNFPLVYTKESLAVSFGGTSAKVLRLIQGDSSGARITVLVPPGSPGVVDVSVAHTYDASKAATFTFEYVDSRMPYASSFSPARVYADGGHAVTVYMTDFPDVQDASEVSASATAADGSQLTFAVVSSARSAHGVTAIVFTTVPSSPGKAAVVMYTSVKKALPFLLDLVAVPAGAPQVKQLAPSIAECRAGSPIALSMHLGSFRELSDASHLHVTVGGITTTPTRVSSFKTGTAFAFSTDIDAPAGGEYEVRAWSSTNASKVAVSTFECTDTTVASLVGAFPDQGFARSDTLNPEP